MKLTYTLLRKQRTHNLRYIVRTLLMKLAPGLYSYIAEIHKNVGPDLVPNRLTLKEFFEKVNFEKKSTKKWEKLPSMQKVRG